MCLLKGLVALLVIAMGMQHVDGSGTAKILKSDIGSNGYGVDMQQVGAFLFVPGQEFVVYDGKEPIVLEEEIEYTTIFYAIPFRNTILLFASRGLYSTNGTRNGTTLLMDQIGISPYRNEAPIVYRDKVFFSRERSETGRELWVTDGTMEGTVLVKDLVEGETDAYPRYFHIVNELLCFSVILDGSVYGDRTIFVTDGTSNGTYPIQVPGLIPNYNDLFGIPTVVGEYLYFPGGPAKYGTDIWRTNGTVEGTTLVRSNLEGGGILGSVGSRLVFADDNFFTLDGEGSAQVLWEADDPDSFTNSLTSKRFQDKLFMSPTNTLGSSSVLYVTDGTPENTGIAVDVAPYSNLEKLTVSENKMYFIASSSTSVALWETDGTQENTKVVPIAWPDGMNSTFLDEVDEMLAYKGQLIFDAWSGTRRDLWKIEIETTSTAIPTGPTSGPITSIPTQMPYEAPSDAPSNSQQPAPYTLPSLVPTISTSESPTLLPTRAGIPTSLPTSAVPLTSQSPMATISDTSAPAPSSIGNKALVSWTLLSLLAVVVLL